MENVLEDVEATPLSRARGRILVADDDASVRYLAATALQAHGHTVDLASDGAEACRRFAEAPADVVFMDLGMPGLDGFEACRTLRSQTHGERVPILILTQREDVESIGRAFEAGAMDFQTKPINWQVLGARVQYVLRAKADADALVQRTRHDSLTGALSRTHFLERLERALVDGAGRDESVAVVFIDLDDFKAVNDRLGHALGDELLQQAAARITDSLRLPSRPVTHGPSPEPVVGRFGGDEFTLVVPRLHTPGDVSAICDRLHAAFEAPFVLSDRDVFVTISTGASVAPEDGTTATTLLRRADRAMYVSKAHGRSRHTSYRMAEARWHAPAGGTTRRTCQARKSETRVGHRFHGSS